MRVQVDVKYVPELVAGLRVYNYVAVDECTRMRFARGYYDLKQENTVDFLTKMKQFFPFDVEVIQTDNGFEFTNRLNPNASNVEHKMDQWCRENQIRHRCIPPGEKELNGKVERSHRIDEQFFYWKAPTDSIDNFNIALMKWLNFYNNKRLHGGLNFFTPIEKLWQVYEETKKSPAPELINLRSMPKRFQAYIEIGRFPKKAA